MLFSSSGIFELFMLGMVIFLHMHLIHITCIFPTIVSHVFVHDMLMFHDNS
jgi:hypothetical protein